MNGGLQRRMSNEYRADGSVLNAGGMLFPSPGAVNFGNQVAGATAARMAVREVNSQVADTYEPRELSAAASLACWTRPDATRDCRTSPFPSR